MANRILVKRSKVFVTDNVRAVFPHLAETDRFGKYSIDVDVLNDPTLRQTIDQQAAAFLAQAQQELGVSDAPTNALFRQGEYKDEAFERVSFKMNATRKVKGTEVEQAPVVVDAKKAPVTELVYGGSLVKVAYFFQFTKTPNGCFLSPKLKAVQVIEHVGPGGDTTTDTSFFGEEDGFTTSGEVVEPTAAPAPPAAPSQDFDF